MTKSSIKDLLRDKIEKGEVIYRDELAELTRMDCNLILITMDQFGYRYSESRLSYMLEKKEVKENGDV